MKIKSIFTVKSAVISFVFFMVMYVLINIPPFGLARLTEITGGQSILDMELSGYTSDRAYEVLDALGQEGRNFHLKSILPLDFIFPLSYGIFYFITLTLITKNIFKSFNKPWAVGLLGIAAALFDYTENILVMKLLIGYPDRLDKTAHFAGIITKIKFLLSNVNMVLIFMGIITLIIIMLYNKSKAKKSINLHTS